MLVFEGMMAGSFVVKDMADGMVKEVSEADLRGYLISGVEIIGLSMDDEGNICDADGVVLVTAPRKVKNANLSKAKAAKNDEFYTQLCDIEAELSHYPEGIFRDKVIYCPMDVATTHGAIQQSAFIKYFQMHAHELGFKELIATCLHDKSTGEGYADSDERSNNYHLVRREVSYATVDGKASGRVPIAEEKGEDGRLYYRYTDGRMELMPDVVVNEAVLDENGKLVIDSIHGVVPQLYTYRGYFHGDCPADEGYQTGGGVIGRLLRLR